MPEEPRQRIERVGRSDGKPRRARLTPAPGTDASPETPGAGHGPDDDDAAAKRRRAAATSDDERITRERPPHW